MPLLEYYNTLEVQFHLIQIIINSRATWYIMSAVGIIGNAHDVGEARREQGKLKGFRQGCFAMGCEPGPGQTCKRNCRCHYQGGITGTHNERTGFRMRNRLGYTQAPAIVKKKRSRRGQFSGDARRLAEKTDAERIENVRTRMVHIEKGGRLR